MSKNKEDYLILQTLRVNALYNNAVIPVIVMLCGATGLTVIFWNGTNTPALISWYLTLIVITAVRCFIVFKYQRSNKKPEEYPFWLNLYFAGTLLSGLVWGATTYLLPTEKSVIELGLITMFMLVVISGSIGIYSVFKRIYYSLSLPTILPLILFLFMQESKQLNQLCLITSLFTFFIFIIHYHAQKITNQLLLLKIDNKILLDHHESDQEKISILERLNNTRTKQLEKVRLELNDLKHKQIGT
ncbi:MAG: hypothetical protein DHS20C09_12960 [marine bacterium B5-7]|nr:MAG: hypothetical protein DHS20C09_12960 [marine bacterium B5-7]